MAQVEHPANLDRWGNPAYRLITIILIRCGLRVSDATTAALDCVVTDADGAPYLRYLNHKMKREALVPIDEELAGLIAEQQQRILRTLARRHPGLFPGPHEEPRRHPPDQHAAPTGGAAPLAGALRHPRRARPAGAPDPAPMAPHPRHPADQPGRPPGSRARSSIMTRRR